MDQKSGSKHQTKGLLDPSDHTRRHHQVLSCQGLSQARAGHGDCWQGRDPWHHHLWAAASAKAMWGNKVNQERNQAAISQG